MAKFLFLCFLLLTNSLLSLAIATNQPQISFQSISIPSSSNPPSESPYNGIRKLGRHQKNKHLTSFDSPSPSPSESPQSEKKKVHSSVPNHQKTSVDPKDGEIFGSQEGQIQFLKHHHHHSFDKSIAGGGVILGGLATTFLVSVFCYIRATGRHKSETISNS